jgi:hypothetical protein
MSRPYWMLPSGPERDAARRLYCNQHPTPEERAARRARKRAARNPPKGGPVRSVRTGPDAGFCVGPSGVKHTWTVTRLSRRVAALAAASDAPALPDGWRVDDSIDGVAFVTPSGAVYPCFLHGRPSLYAASLASAMEWARLKS